MRSKKKKIYFNTFLSIHIHTVDHHHEYPQRNIRMLRLCIKIHIIKTRAFASHKHIYATHTYIHILMSRHYAGHSPIPYNTYICCLPLYTCEQMCSPSIFIITFVHIHWTRCIQYNIICGVDI